MAPVCVDGMERSASAKASADLYWAGGVDTSSGIDEAAVGAETVDLVSAISTTKDLDALSIVWILSVIGLSSPLSSATSLAA